MNVTPEQISAALARWMGWELREGVVYFKDGVWQRYLAIHEGIDPEYYFNPYGNLNHAWMLVQHIHRNGSQEQRTCFGQWFNHADLWSYPDYDAPRAICDAVLEICEVEV